MQMSRHDYSHEYDWLPSHYGHVYGPVLDLHNNIFLPDLRGGTALLGLRWWHGPTRPTATVPQYWAYDNDMALLGL